jgi:putative ABC transport system ATP-binding protein
VTEAVIMEAVARHFRSGGRRFSALRQIDLSVTEGELVAVYGRSGSGKTTLLSMAGGLDRPDEGRVQAAGEEVSSLSDAALERFRRDKVGWVFQASGLHPLLTAAENVALALRIQGCAAPEAQQAAQVALAEVGLAARARHRPHELSGGEQQRVALARAMVKRPRLLLADEPTGQLDTATARQVLALVRAAADAGITVLIVSHDEALAEIADRVLQIQDGTLSG